ncbi:AMP-binding protein [Phreatobacter stygius]|uniref:Long-chain-fatty-acid--CoA ligase n=1 Tax=Phreatobacter stygius TaxID=1940610 RepID=A0A4D7AS81_9HYPH|nr:AMP-binding protein [Phreatobacter stygius]QCI63829.1 long-chain fatty acid--CoA ligase [Phreatobacter stygius]
MTTIAATPNRPWTKFYPVGIRATIDEAPYPSLAAMVRSIARTYASQPAFSLCLSNGMGGSLTFADIDRLSDAFALYLREQLQLKPGARVALQTPNALAFPIVAFGVFKAGCVLVNINPLYTADEMGKVFADAEPDCLVIIDMFADKLPTAFAIHKVRHVVICRITEFMPWLQGTIVGFVQKYKDKSVKPSPVAHTTFQTALTTGEARRGSVDVTAYSSDIGLETLACLQYTGGTTGVSKGAMLTHGNLIMNMAQSLEMVAGDIEKGKGTILTALPLYHIFAFTVNMLGFWYLGAHNILIPNPRPLTNLQKAFEKYPITAITGVNTLFNGLNNEAWFKDNPPKYLKTASAGGMALQEAVAKRWHEVTGTPVIEGYGLTESSPVLSFNPMGNVRLGTIGIPVPSTDIKCVDDEGREVPLGQPGELVAKGPQIMAGYWKKPEDTAKTIRDGWLYTGDIAIQDEDGFFKIVDRKKDMVLVSGFNVFPNEVEDTLAKNPAVLEVAVVGVPDGAAGEAVKAYIVKRPGTEITSEEVRAYCRLHLTAYKVPKFVEFRDELPKSNVGKILRKDLRAEELAKKLNG